MGLHLCMAPYIKMTLSQILPRGTLGQIFTSKEVANQLAAAETEAE